MIIVLTRTLQDLATQFALRDLCPGEINQRRQGCILSAEDMRSYGPTLEYEVCFTVNERFTISQNQALFLAECSS